MENPNRRSNVLLDRNFFLLFFGTVFSNVGMTLYSFAASFYLLEISGNNAFMQGAYLAVCGVTYLLFAPIGGVLADRYNRAVIVYASDLIKGAVFLLIIPLFSFTSAAEHAAWQIAALFFLGFVNNMVGAIFSPAASALIPTIVSEEKRQQANGYFSALNSVQSILGIALAGALYAAVSIPVFFLLIGAGYMLSGISEIFIRCRHEPPANALTLGGMARDYADAIRYLRSMPALLLLLSGILFVNFFVVPYFGNAIPYFFRVYLANGNYLFSNWMTPEMWAGAVNVFGSVGTLVMSLYLSGRPARTRIGRNTARFLYGEGAVLIALTVAFAVFVQWGNNVNAFILSLCAGLFIASASSSGVNVPAHTAFQNLIPQNNFAKVMSLVGIFSLGITPLASLIGGVMIDRFGLLALFAFCSIGFAVSALAIGLNRKTDEI